MGLNLIQTGRFNRLFQKLFSIKGGANVTEVGAEILPIIPIRIGMETRNLEGWNRFGVAVNQAAVAGNNSTIRFRNPGGSTVVAVIERLLVGMTAADQPTLGNAAISTDLATVVIPAVRSNLDARSSPTNPTVVISKSSPGAGVFSGLMQVFFGANGQADFVIDENTELPLLPGDAYQIVSNIVNQSLIVSAFWRERAMEESELK